MCDLFLGKHNHEVLLSQRIFSLDFPFFISEPAVHALEGAWGAIVVLCARSDTVIEWNHANEDGFSVHTATGAECGGTGQFLMTSLILTHNEGATDFSVDVRSTNCDDSATFASDPVSCSCPASSFGQLLFTLLNQLKYTFNTFKDHIRNKDFAFL